MIKKIKNNFNLSTILMILIMISVSSPSLADAMPILENDIQRDIIEQPMDALVIHYSGCKHSASNAEVDNHNFDSCHAQVISGKGNYGYNLDKGIQEKLPTEGNGWKYDYKTNTLTLENFIGEAISARNVEDNVVDFNIKLIGENILTNSLKGRKVFEFENVNVKFLGNGSIKLIQDELMPNCEIRRGNLHLKDNTQVEVVALQVPIVVLGKYGDSADGSIIVDKGAKLIAKTTLNKETEMPLRAIKAERLSVSGIVIGETYPDRYNRNGGIESNDGFRLNDGVTLKIGRSLDDMKILNIEKINGYNKIKYEEMVPYMEISARSPIVKKPVKLYTIQYNLNGGTNSKKNPANYDGTRAIILEKPINPGYSFGGWYSDKSLTKKVVKIEQNSKKNFILYAKWNKAVNLEDVMIEGIKDVTYTGKAIKLPIILKSGTTKLTEKNDYVVTYKNNVKVGEAEVVLTGKGKYKGTIKRTFNILPIIEKTKANNDFILTMSQNSSEVYNVSLRDPELKKTYVTNQLKNDMYAQEYYWNVRFWLNNGTSDIEFSLFIFQGKTGTLPTETKLTEMQNGLFVMGDYAPNKIGEVELTTEDKIIKWQFTMPEKYKDYKLSTAKNIKVITFDSTRKPDTIFKEFNDLKIENNK